MQSFCSRHPPAIPCDSPTGGIESGTPLGDGSCGSLGRLFLQTYAHLFPGDLRAVADATDVARSRASGSGRSPPLELFMGLLSRPGTRLTDWLRHLLDTQTLQATWAALRGRP